MDCVFKAWGYVPKHRLCRKCEPLEGIFRSLGYDKKEKSKAISRIFKAYTMIKADDVLRDETSGVKKATAKLVKKLSRLSATEELKLMVDKADRIVRDLEASSVDAEEYVSEISVIGGKVFQTSTGDAEAYNIGQTLSAATTIHDMTTDLERDRRKGRFNPLKDVPPERLRSTITDLLTLFMGDPLLPYGGPQTSVFSQQVSVVSGDFWGTCIGVCTGICSALALYECCCR